MVYPKGMDDVDFREDHYPSWNILSTPCVEEHTKALGFPACYHSCENLGYCSADKDFIEANSTSVCNWNTCYDDIFFIQNLVDEMIENFGPIDDSKFVIIGGSNGGMMTYQLSGNLQPEPSHFIPIYGNSPKGFEVVTNGKANLLSFYDVYDTTVPMQGGESTDEWMDGFGEFLVERL